MQGDKPQHTERERGMGQTNKVHMYNSIKFVVYLSIHMQPMGK